MLSLFRKSPRPATVSSLYAALVAQSRQPRFYAQWGVPDTVTGRFDMLSLHMVLLFRRLKAEPAGSGARALAQALFDMFFKDMDRSLREMGAGDLGVPKKIRKMSEMFYGLLAALEAALASDDADAVEAVLRRNIYPGEETADVRPLADYVAGEAARLAALPMSAIAAGRLDRGEAA